jgi:murein DD-endopeptidase MepM/ murein hydrolase activator NlpD
VKRDLPTAEPGGPRNSDASQRRFATHRHLRRISAGLAALALGMTMAVPAWADDLTDQRDRVSQDLSAAQSKLEAATKDLANASSALQQSRGQLNDAQNQLAEIQRHLAQAQADDQAAAARWAKAQDELEAAKAAVAEGERNLRAQQIEVGNVVRTQYQQRTGLVGIGIVVNGTHTRDINNRVQWSTTVFDSTQAELNQLKEVQRVLQAAQQKQAAIERDLAEQRAEAAAQLAHRERLNASAAEQVRTVAALVQANGQAEAAAARLFAANESQARALVSEQSAVEQRIADRLEAQRAEELRQAQAERQRRETAAIEQSRRDADAAQARGQAGAAKQGAEAPRADSERVRAAAAEPAPNAHNQASAREGISGAPAGQRFLKPAEGPITSRYGMRLHPVLRVWKLHDGTDLGSGCNTPIRAAYDGVVTERYYNPGYGNRLMIDHGRIDGRFVTTGYNHATRYTARVGDRVRRGDLIGYVGSTGYSTGCHLHLMLWLDGRVVNPEPRFFG